MKRVLRKIRRGRYDGPVVFMDGVHYPAGKDGQRGHRLLWDSVREEYFYWDGKGGSHQDRYHVKDVEMAAGG